MQHGQVSKEELINVTGLVFIALEAGCQGWRDSCQGWRDGLRGRATPVPLAGHRPGCAMRNVTVTRCAPDFVVVCGNRSCNKSTAKAESTAKIELVSKMMKEWRRAGYSQPAFTCRWAIGLARTNTMAPSTCYAERATPRGAVTGGAPSPVTPQVTGATWAGAWGSPRPRRRRRSARTART